VKLPSPLFLALPQLSPRRHGHEWVGPLGLFRTLSYVLIGTLFGSFALILFAWPEGVEYQVCKRFLRLTWIFAALATFAVLVFTTAQLTGKGVTSSLSPNAWRDLTDSLPGWGILLRCVFVGLAGIVAWNPERILDPGTQGISIGSLVAMCSVFGLDRSGGRIEVLGYINAGLHMLAVSVWFGGLVLLVRVVLIGSGDSDLVQAVRGFSRLAPRAIAVVVLTGVISTYRYDGFALLSNAHGRILLLKIAVVGFMTYCHVHHAVLHRGTPGSSRHSRHPPRGSSPPCCWVNRPPQASWCSASRHG